MLEFNNKRLNITIGFVSIVLLLAFFMSMYKSENSSHKSSITNSYKVYVKDVSGIKKNQPVSIGGYPVGFVDSIGINNNATFLSLSINKNIPLTADSRIQISNVSLLSSIKTINIINGIDEEILTNNSYIPDANLGIDLDKLLNMIEIYLKQKNKQGN